MLDFFVSSEPRQTRIFLKAEGFQHYFQNQSPFHSTKLSIRDFMILRWGILDNFFRNKTLF